MLQYFWSLVCNIFFYVIIWILIITCSKGGGKCVCPRLFVCRSVCLLARLLKNACMDLDEMLSVDRCRDMDELIKFWVRFGLQFGCRNQIAFSLLYKLSYTKFYVGKIPHIRIGVARWCSDAWVLEWFYSITRRNNFVGGTCTSLQSSALSPVDPKLTTNWLSSCYKC